MMKTFLAFSIAVISLLILNSCDTNEVVPNNVLNLSIEDVSCTEAWLQFTSTGLELPNTLTLYVDDKISEIISLSTEDTLLYIDSLLPNRTYKILAAIKQSDDASNELSIKTMDTTSHNFSWQTFTFGETGTGSSTLYDVAIIDENDIWAVGEIYTEDSYTYDSLGNWVNPYNAIHWDGSKWELKRIYYVYNGANLWGPIRTILAFNANDIWFGAGIHWNDLNFTTKLMNIDFPYQINKLWGISSSDLYIVGNEGNIAHYNGSSWTKIESGTSVDLKDICGAQSGEVIWTCGWSNSDGRVSLLKVDKDYVTSIWDNQTNPTLSIYRGTLLNSLYANGQNEFILVGGQVLRHSLVNQSDVKLEWIKTYTGSKVLELGNYGYRIKGSNKNNIFISGDASMIWHFNGFTWYKYLEQYNLNDILYGLAVTDNIIATVGKRYSSGSLGGALLIIGRR